MNSIQAILLNGGVTDDHGYVLFVVTTVHPFLHHDLSPIMTYYRILNKNNTVGLSLVEQKLLPPKRYEVSPVSFGVIVLNC